jgi:hypothetical protein
MKDKNVKINKKGKDFGPKKELKRKKEIID